MKSITGYIFKNPYIYILPSAKAKWSRLALIGMRKPNPFQRKRLTGTTAAYVIGTKS